MPKVSIIVPIYKVENYMNKCVDSLLAQTLSDIEIILVDDGSPDNCGILCDEYKKKDSRVRVIHKENGGLSEARNTGLEIAAGEYIGFVDSDDFVDQDMFRRLYKACIENDTLIAGCDLSYVYDKSSRVDQNSKHIECVFTSQEFFEKMLDVNLYVRTGVWNKIYKSELFNNVRFPKGKLFEDIGTMYKLIFATDRISYISEVGYFYLKQRDGAITNQKYSKKEYDRLEMSNLMVDYIIKNQKELIPTVMGYRAVNCDLSIINSMISSNVIDKTMIKFVKNDLRKNFKYIIISNQKKAKKCQITIMALSFFLYKMIYLIMKSGVQYD